MLNEISQYLEHYSECYLCLVSFSYDTDTLLIISCSPLATHHGSLENPSVFKTFVVSSIIIQS